MTDSVYCSWCNEQTPSNACRSCGKDPRLHDYLFLNPLGHGATGQTWRAKKGDDLVAIKEMSFRRLADLKQLELFERESNVLADLDHDSIPKYLEDFVREDGKHIAFYLVQEFVTGTALDEASVTDETNVIEMMKQIAHVLEYLRTRRPPVVHRDVKPSNIMRNTDGRHVLIDFGSTRLAAGATGSTVAGTLGYMAPEQLMGKATPASDMYGLGATAASLLVGKSAEQIIDPFSPSAWTVHADNISPNLKELITDMLCAIPEERPSPIELLDRLANVNDPKIEEPEPPEPEERRRRLFSPFNETVDEVAERRRLETLRAQKPPSAISKIEKDDGVKWVGDIPIISVGRSKIAKRNRRSSGFLETVVRRPWTVFMYSQLVVFALLMGFAEQGLLNNFVVIPISLACAVMLWAIVYVVAQRVTGGVAPTKLSSTRQKLLHLITQEIEQRGVALEDEATRKRVETALDAAEKELEDKFETRLELPYIGANEEGPVHFKKTVSKADLSRVGKKSR